MSDPIAPISDALDSQQRILAEEEQAREMLARLSASDQIQRVQNDDTALAARLAQLREQDQTLSHIKDALNITSAAQAAVGNSNEILARLKELALRSTSETLGAAQREELQVEFTSLKLQLDRLATVTRDNGVPATEEATELSTSSHDLIIGHTEQAVLAQANQVPGVALKLLEET